MRVLSLNFRKALFSPESSEVPIFLLTITHPQLGQPILLSTDPTIRVQTQPDLVYGTVSRGKTYLYAGIDITLPNEQERSPPASKLTIDNVTRDLIPLARSIATPAQVKIEAVLASALDTVEMTFPQLDMSTLDYDASTLTFSLTMDALVTEPYPAGTFGPAYFPALFY